MKMYFLQLLWLFHVLCISTNAQSYEFPPSMKFGVASSSYQIEGAWTEDGKGENIWDRLTHEKSSLIADESNGDVACDSYNLYERDIEMVSALGVDYYRFSLSWSRILPTGFSNSINQAGVDYYNKLIDGLIAKNITPFVTIYHWDLPQPIEDLGGWTNDLIIDYIADYANVVFSAFGDRVKHWITINEPKEICDGYGTAKKAPAYNFHGIADYLVAHNILKAHAKMYHLYNEKYRQEGSQIGIVFNPMWFEAGSNSTEDMAASERAMLFSLGWHAHPVFASAGDYPQEMREVIDEKSRQQRYAFSRLPNFTPEEVKYIKGTSDFFGLNHYTTRLVRPQSADDENEYDVPSREDDTDVTFYFDDSWPKSAATWLRVVPWGFRRVINWINTKYENPNIWIFENGFPGHEGLEDEDRVYYLTEYLKALHEAIYIDNCNVVGYTHWTLMDNFEWLAGYSHRFGLYQVDFDSPNKTRTMRKSGKIYQDIIRRRAVYEADIYTNL